MGKSKVAIVTTAGRGIGAAVARELTADYQLVWPDPFVVAVDVFPDAPLVGYERGHDLRSLRVPNSARVRNSGADQAAR